jgi:hypothetical protein
MIAPRRLRRLLDANGGFTLDPRSGSHITRGLSVCLDPDRAWGFRRSAWDDERVAGWLAAHAAELRRDRRYLGGWLDAGGDHVWLDVVRVVPRLAMPLAVRLARQRGQRSVYDLSDGRIVAVAAG